MANIGESGVLLLLSASHKTNRKIILLGRSMVNVVKVAMELGYLNVPDDMIIDATEAKNFPRERVTVLRNGDSLDITNRQAEHTRQVTVGNTFVDGFGIGDVGDIVLRDRKHLAEDGILVVIITLSQQESTLLSEPEVITRGFVYVKESVELLNVVRNLALLEIEKLQQSENDWKWSQLKTNVRDSIGKFLYAETRRRPMILPIIIEV